MIKGIINYRPICVFALTEAAGIAVTSMLTEYAAARGILVAVSLVALVILLLFKLKRFTYIPVAFALGILLFSGVYGVYASRLIEYNDTEITATISSEIVEDDGHYYFNVENLTVNGEEFKKTATVYAYNLPDERAGEKIIIKGDVKSKTFDVSSGWFLSSIRNGSYYSIYADEIDGLGEGSLKPLTRFRVSLKRKLYNTVDAPTADIATALVLGDKYGIDDGLYGDVQDSGLAHVFAVSGLHVGILAGIFIFLSNKLKLKGWKKFVFVMVWPMIYAVVCGFPASVIRATIMTAVFLLANISGRQRDGLNSLALAAIITMTLFPTDVFSAGFKMSFIAVFALITVYPTFSRRLKILPKGIKNIVSASLAVNILLLPIIAEMFGEVQTLFIITNMFILPIMPFMFAITLFICTFVQIIPSATPLLTVLTVVDWPIKAASVTIGSLAFSSLRAEGIGLAALAYFFAVLILSDLVFLPRRTKGKITVLSVATGICLFLI